MNAGQHELRMLQIARNRLSVLLEQWATSGDNAAPHIITEIRSIRKNIVSHKKILADEHSFEVDDIPGIDFDVQEEVVTITLTRDIYERLKIIAEAYNIDI